MASSFFAKRDFNRPGLIDLFIGLPQASHFFTAFFAFVLIPVGGTVNIYGVMKFRCALLMSMQALFFSSPSLHWLFTGLSLPDGHRMTATRCWEGLRGTAQMISYEIPMGLSLLTVILSAGTLSLPEIVEAQSSHWFIWTNPIGFIIYLITAFAETNRAPFDLPEAEQELTGGYHTEYGGMKFAVFFLAEYVNILAVSAIAITLFLGGWLGPGNIPVIGFWLKSPCLFSFLCGCVRRWPVSAMTS